MTAQKLRDAAKVLRDGADGAHFVTHNEWSTDGHQVVSGSGGWCLVATTSEIPEDDRLSSYIATMHPGVGLALADWLDTAGADLWAHGPLCECGSGCLDCDDSLWQPHVRRALAVADLILGGAA